MFATLLALHSLVRWLVLTVLVLAIFRAYRGWRLQLRFTRFDNAVRIWVTTIAHVQLLLGLSLYCISPMVRYFLNYFSEAVHHREARFFGMEHIFMMLMGIIVLTIGSAKAKRREEDNASFKTMAIWFTIALLITISSVPWAFSPLTSRPSFRPF